MKGWVVSVPVMKMISGRVSLKKPNKTQKTQKNPTPTLANVWDRVILGYTPPCLYW